MHLIVIVRESVKNLFFKFFFWFYIKLFSSFPFSTPDKIMSSLSGCWFSWKRNLDDFCSTAAAAAAAKKNLQKNEKLFCSLFFSHKHKQRTSSEKNTGRVRKKTSFSKLFFCLCHEQRPWTDFGWRNVLSVNQVTGLPQHSHFIVTLLRTFRAGLTIRQTRQSA